MTGYIAHGDNARREVKTQPDIVRHFKHYQDNECTLVMSLFGISLRAPELVSLIRNKSRSSVEQSSVGFQPAKHECKVETLAWVTIQRREYQSSIVKHLYSCKDYISKGHRKNHSCFFPLPFNVLSTHNTETPAQMKILERNF